MSGYLENQLVEVVAVRSPDGAVHGQMAKQSRLEHNCVGDDLLFTVPPALQCRQTVNKHIGMIFSYCL